MGDKVKWTYIGKREATTGKLGDLFLDENGKHKFFLSAKRSYAFGSVYMVEKGNREGKYFLHDAQFIGPSDAPKEEFNAWEVADTEARTNDKCRKAEARIKESIPSLYNCLAPIIQAGRKTNPQTRSVMLLKVVTILRESWLEI